MILWLALAAAAAQPTTVRGTVTDPDARPVSAVHLELVCGSSRVVAESDARGAFNIIAPAGRPCLLEASHPGFETATRQLVEPAARPLSIRLAIARREERIDVRASPPTPARAATGIAGTAVLAPGQLRIVGPDAARWLALAEVLAGNPLGTRDLRVNGMDTAAPPQSGIVTSVRVASDPFSAEFSGADRIPVEITTEPGGRWQVSASPGLFTAGHRGVLDPSASHSTQSRSINADGPLNPSGRLRIFASAFDTHSNDTPTYLDPSGAKLIATLQSSATSRGLTAGLANWLGPLALQSAFTATDSNISNAGVGGRSGPDSALAISSSSRQFQVSWRRAGAAVAIRGGFAMTRQRQEATAMAAGTGRLYADRLIAGAPDLQSLTERATSVQLRTVVESSTGTAARWLAGIETTLDDFDGTRTFNPEGVLIVTDPAATRGALLERPGTITAPARTRTVAVFGQRIMAATDRHFLRIGARADWQRADGVSVAPRVAAGVRLRGFLVGSNIGVFTDPWSSSAELERQFRIAAPLLTVTSANRVSPVTLTGQPGSRRDVVARASIVRPMGKVLVVVEETWTRGRHLSGLVRSAVAGTLVDTLDLTRSMSRWLTHVRVDVSRGSWTTSAHYEFADAHDNTDGTFSWPAIQSDLGSEWAPARGVPRHAFNAVTSGTARGGVQWLLTARAAAGTPYSLVSGLDPDGLFTFTGRTGGRNRERQPSTSDLSAYASRSFRLPFGGFVIDSGVRLENILGSVTPLEIERLGSSPYAGRPVSAAPGRTMSVWATIHRR